MHEEVLRFIEDNLAASEVENKKILEVGSFDVNGSPRTIIENMHPAEYLGADIVKGPGVEVICSASNLVSHFGKNSFDVVVCTEVVEHIKDWREAFTNMKDVLAPHGVLIVTTVGIGFPLHGFPCDYWRFEKEDMEEIFSDFQIDSITTDEGMFVRTTKPENYHMNDLSQIRLYSMIKKKRVADVSGLSTLPLKTMIKIAKTFPFPERVEEWFRRKFS